MSDADDLKAYTAGFEATLIWRKQGANEYVRPQPPIGMSVEDRGAWWEGSFAAFEELGVSETAEAEADAEDFVGQVVVFLLGVVATVLLFSDKGIIIFLGAVLLVACARVMLYVSKAQRIRKSKSK